MGMLVATLVASAVTLGMPRDVGLVSMDETGAVASLALGPEELDSFCRVGPDGDSEPLDLGVVRAATGWTVGARVHLYVGPRNIGVAEVSSISLAGGCRVEATLAPLQPLPWTAPSDVLWASVRQRPSSPLLPAPRGLVHRAESAMAEDLGRMPWDEDSRRACLADLRVVARGTGFGALVGVSCYVDAGAFWALYAVDRRQRALAVRRAALNPDGPAVLLDVITPHAKRVLDVVMDVPGPRGRERRWERVRLPEVTKTGSTLPAASPRA